MKYFSGKTTSSSTEAASTTPDLVEDTSLTNTAQPETTSENTETDVLDADFDDGVYVEGDDYYYSTGEVAKRLGISRDMTRKHIHDFEEFLHITYSQPEGKYRHMRLLSTDMDLLEKIVRLRKNRHSIESIKQLLRDPDILGPMMLSSGDVNNVLPDLLARNNVALLTEVKKLIDDGVDQNRKLLESNEKKDQAIDTLHEEVDELKGLLLKQTETIQAMKEALDEQAASNAKKKGFWGLFK